MPHAELFLAMQVIDERGVAARLSFVQVGSRIVFREEKFAGAVVPRLNDDFHSSDHAVGFVCKDEAADNVGRYPQNETVSDHKAQLYARGISAFTPRYSRETHSEQKNLIHLGHEVIVACVCGAVRL